MVFPGVLHCREPRSISESGRRRPGNKRLRSAIRQSGPSSEPTGLRESPPSVLDFGLAIARTFPEIGQISLTD